MSKKNRSLRLPSTATLYFLAFFSLSADASIDTLKDTSDVRDCIIYSFPRCNVEAMGDDCRRYNAGLITNLPVGTSGVSLTRRALLKFPGWTGIIPDSSKLLLYHKGGADSLSRLIFLYPVTTQFFEGSELNYNLGYFPDPDSGATWYHSWLDVGDADSSTWLLPGGDYTTAVADTMLVHPILKYFAFNNFNRILTYWDTSGNTYGVILINQDALPPSTSMKVFGTSEYDTAKIPLLILYYPDTLSPRRRRIIETLSPE